MKKSKKELINMFFGTNSKTRFRRLVLYTALIAVIIMLTLNLRCDENGLGWGPAADINFNVGDGVPGGGPVQ